MPELPEVETIVRDLQRLVTGAVVRRTTVLRDDLVTGDPRHFERALAQREIEKVGRRAKNIVMGLHRDRLVINLGMTGRVVVRAAGAPEPPYLGVRFDLADGRSILYQDARRFGRLRILPADEWERCSAAMGIEPLQGDFSPEHLYRMTRESRVAIKTWLMDQRRVVGIGNIYASEALFRAGISPRRAARRLSRRQVVALHDAIGIVLREAISFRGTTLLDYRDAAGERGEFARRLQVYDREGQPCVACMRPIRRVVQGGRSTYYCSGCQR
jgi:formamidopyrimidine-DNA glycosylase